METFVATYQLRTARILAALFAGSVVGAVVVALAFNLPYLLETGPGGMFMVLMTFIVALAVWAAGLGIIGAPLWGLAERAGLRSFHHAVALGLIVTFVAAVLLTFLIDVGTGLSLGEGGQTLVRQGRRTPEGLWALVHDSGLFALLGALVAAVIWRIAYRREATL